jgi:peptidoglycan/xylan/chitin deacetylase (PgdA/CDA1 family)
MPGLAGSDAPLSRPRVAISFDDGYRGVHTDIRPLLRSAAAPATMFVPTGFLGQRFRYEALKLALRATPKRSFDFDGRRLPLRSPAERKDAWHAMNVSLRLLSAEARDARIDAVIVALDVPPSAIRGADVVSAEELAEMAKDLAIGSHTVSHPNLSLLDRAAIERELSESKRQIEAITGQPCRLFAYPIGRADDYTPLAFDVLRAVGYARAFTAVPTTDVRSTFEYPRIGVGDEDTVETLAIKLSTLWPSVFRLIG